MKVHLRQIPEQGLHIEGEDHGVEIDVEFVKPLTPVHYSLDVGLSGTGLFATGKLEVDLELQCSNCLKKFKYPMRLEDFALQTELEGAETVDLTPFAREDILLNLPQYPKCDRDGGKVCQGTLKFESTAGPETARETLPPGPGAWDELDKLKVKKRK